MKTLSQDYSGKRELFVRGIKQEIDADSIETIAYELIMPKIYKTLFGLKEHDDLQEILADPEFFAKRAVKKLDAKLNSDQYDYELKRFTGDHVYLWDSSKGTPDPSLYHPTKRYFVFEEKDGTYSLVDHEGEVIHKMASKDDTVVESPSGELIIVSNNPAFYIENLSYNIASFSNTRVTEEELTNLCDNLRSSTTPEAKKFVRTFTDKFHKLKKFNELKKRNTDFGNISDLNPAGKSSEMLAIREEILQEGRIVYTSFDKSLDIIAGRIPAQSQQSFMPQRVVAFDSSNINSAYVSTFQLFLQGSDLDIDAVTLLGSEFDKHGHYVMWSPYANLNSKELLAASQTIPFPSGVSTEITHDNNKDSFFITYNDYFGENNLFMPTRDAEGNIVTNEEGAPILSINTSTPEGLKKLAKFIQEVEKTGLNLKGDIGSDMRYLPNAVLDQEIYGDNWKSQNLNIFKYIGARPNHLRDLLLQIKQVVDTHNLYIKHTDRRTREAMCKNQCQYRMYLITSDPANIEESQESVDSSTKEFKGGGGNPGAVKLTTTDDDKYRVTSGNEALNAPMNTYSKANSIYIGQAGKQGVSIGAVAIKANSTTQYALDYILNYGSDEAVRRLLLPIGKGKETYQAVGEDGQVHDYPRRGYKINGKWYESIANLYDKSTEQGQSRLRDVEVLHMLDSLNSEADLTPNVATKLAAMLSLAVDNAKDLALGKINAGPKMYGMYAYGISIGIPVIELATIINSPQGRVLSKVMQGNLITGEQGQIDVAHAFEYLEGRSLGNLFDQFDFSLEEYRNGGIGNTSIQECRNASDVLQKHLTDFCKKKYKDMKNFSLKNMVNVLIKTKQLNQALDSLYTSSLFINIAGELNGENSKAYPNGQEWLESIEQLMEAIKEYSNLVNIFNAPGSTYKEDLRILMRGAEEMKILGSILSSNKGVKTKMSEGENFIKNIEEAIVNREKALDPKYKPVPSDYIDYVRFCTDEDYRNQAIKAYDKVKHTVNILDVITAAPHFRSYIRANAIPYAGFLGASSKYRSRQAMLRDGILDKIGAKTTKAKEEAIRGLENGINAAMMMTWLSEARRVFILPRGNERFNSDGTIQKVETDTTIELWTQEGLATFKNYMENKLIPKLKNDISLKSNSFIQNLERFELTKTGSHQEVTAYTLTGDMMANDDAQKTKVEEYKADFKYVKGYGFPKSESAEANRAKSAGNQVIKNYEDAFYLYSEYVFGGKKGKRSLMTMFDDGKNDLQIEFRWAKAEFDSTRDFILTEEEQLRWAAPEGNPYNPPSNVFYSANTIDLGKRLSTPRKNPSDEEKQMLVENYVEASGGELDEGQAARLVERDLRRNPIVGVTINGKSLPKLDPRASQNFLLASDFQGSNKITVNILKVPTEISVDGKITNFNEEALTTALIAQYSAEQLLDHLGDVHKAVRQVIDTINNNLPIFRVPIYHDFGVKMEAINLELINDAFEMARKKAMGEC